jgi:hypothetical protein
MKILATVMLAGIFYLIDGVILGRLAINRLYYLQTPHVPPSWEQCLQYLQFLQALQLLLPVHLPPAA